MTFIAWLRSHRVATNLSGAALCLALLGYALYAQFELGLEPCPLCIFQRIGLMALAVAFGLAALLTLWRALAARFVSVLLIVLAAGTAVGVAGRHVYLQTRPPGTGFSCGINDLGYLMDTFPLVEVLRKVLSPISADCAKVDWTFLGLSMPAWVLLWALALGATGVMTNWPGRRRAA
jgi:disulfide bond formation protein DsbB